MPRSVTVYREIGDTLVKDEVNTDDLHTRYEPALNFHQRIISTYYELEQAGQLNDMSPEEKKRTRQVHEDAQHPEYWGEKDTLGYLPD